MQRMNDFMGEEHEEILLRGRLDGKQRNRLKGLLNMMYSPRELADELGINVNQFYRVYIPGGCPNERDDHRRFWINGKSFRAWFEEIYVKHNLKPGQAFCLTCRQAVTML